MRNTEADTLDELIDDCAALPEELRGRATTPPAPRPAAPWQVTDDCAAQVADLDTYV